MPVMLPPGAVPRSAPPPAALFGHGASPPAIPQPGGGVELQPGESVLPQQPTNPPGYRPSWPAQQAAPQAPPAQPAYAPQQYQPQPQYQQPAVIAPQPQYQQIPAQMVYPQPPAYAPQQPYMAAPVPQPQPPAPAPQPNYQQFTMPADPSYGQPAQQYQFNDGLQLGGRVGGAPAPAAPLGVQPTAPAPAPVGLPPGVPVQSGAGVAHTSTALRDSLVAQGMAVAHYPNDQSLLDDFGQTAQQIGQLRQMARLGWEAQQAGQQPPAAQPPQQAPAPQPQKPAKPARPEWKPAWDGQVRKDPVSGRFVSADAMTNPAIVDRANELAAWERQRAEQLINDGLTTGDVQELLAQQIEAVKEEVRQEIAAEQARAAGQQQIDQFLTQNRQNFYHLDQTGQPIVNNVTGQPLLTPIGQQAMAIGNQYAQSFEQTYGLKPQPQQVIEYVQLRLGTPQAQPQMQAAPQYQPPRQIDPQQLKDQVIQNAVARQQQVMAAAHLPNQAGTIATAAQNATQPQNPRVDFRTQLLQAAEAKGQLPPGYASNYR